MAGGGAEGPVSIFLIGMMASGKSTVGRQLAADLGWDFYDVDHVIEERAGVSISYIFEVEGEAGFRSRETQVMDELTRKPAAVIAMGGGAPLREINRRILERGFTIQLSVTVSDVLERTRHDTARPLLRSDDPARRIREIMLERGPVYDAVSDLRIHTGRSNPHRVSEKIRAVPAVAEVVRRGNAIRLKEKREY